MNERHAWRDSHGHFLIVRAMKQAAEERATMWESGSQLKGFRKGPRNAAQAADGDAWWLDCLSERALSRYEDFCLRKWGCRRKRVVESGQLRGPHGSRHYSPERSDPRAGGPLQPE